jgi:delta-aminolevulinic acid dehydratase/porphobilinogen synthase
MNYSYDGLGNQERARRLKQNKAMLKKAQAKSMEKSKVIEELMSIKPFTAKAVKSLPKLYKTAKEQNRISKRVQKLRLQGYMIQKGK